MAVLQHPDGRVEIKELPSGRRRVRVRMYDESTFVPQASAETSYPLELIERILAWRGPAQLCYSILRDEDVEQLQEPLRHYLLAYVGTSEFEERRLLDFGCGSGSSTVALAKLFPRTAILAVDLEEMNLEIARMRTEHHGITNLEFRLSPGPDMLPRDLGRFDFICLSAVHEHLLPHERTTLLPQLWRLLEPGGTFFITATPHRWYPLEYHTTGLPFLNYFPDRAAFFAARRVSSRIGPDTTWNNLLRSGIRGGTEREIVSILRSARNGDPISLRPRQAGVDAVDLWYDWSMRRRPLQIKRVLRLAFKATSAATRSIFVPDLNLAIRKAPPPS